MSSDVCQSGAAGGIASAAFQALADVGAVPARSVHPDPGDFDGARQLPAKRDNLERL
jgi:hypothetical protein